MPTHEMPLRHKRTKMPVIFFFVSAAIYCVTAYCFGYFSRMLGLILLAVCACYLILTTRMGLSGDEEQKEEEEKPQNRSLFMELMLLVIGAALIAVGADLLVDNGTLIAAALGVPESVIALTFVALGTSLPELVTAISSLTKGHGALSLGNVIGANIFNLVLVTGVSASLAPFAVPNSSTIAGVNASLVLEIPLMLFVMGILTLPALVRKKLSRFQGVLLLAIYFAFCITQFVM